MANKRSLCNRTDFKNAVQKCVLDAKKSSLEKAQTSDKKASQSDRQDSCLDADDTLATNVAIIFIDIDRFDTINAVLGHEFGYRVLALISKRLIAFFSNNELIARMGSDKFAILIPSASPEQLRVKAQQALAQINTAMQIDKQEVLLTASAGIDIYPSSATTAEELIKHSGIAAQHAKQAGGDTCLFFDAAVGKRALKRLNLELDLRRAINDNEIIVHYQPTYSLHLERITGVEALARWHHPHLGWIEPDEFIPIAEETALISDIGYLVLQQACQQGKTWLRDSDESDKGLQHIAVNLSAQQIQDKDLVTNIKRILLEYDFPAKHLTLEITESVFIEAHSTIVASLDALRMLGVRIAIDDFGTGFSSLQILREFPADLLKIDRLFVTEVTENPVDATITKAVIDIAHSLMLTVVAEGVENEAQVAFLRQSNCDAIQGYFVGKAMNSKELAALIA